MPLNHNNGYNGKELPYSIKLAIIESNCVGCSHLHTFGDEKNFDDELGCSYPGDVKDFNAHLREPYLTVHEIASNGCLYWDNQSKWQLEVIDSRPDNPLDNATVPISFRFMQDVSYRPREIIPEMSFSENCGVSY